jgi:hypothetical protein
MPSHDDSFTSSGSSPTQKKKTSTPQVDFRVEFHGAILLLVPLPDLASGESKNISALTTATSRTTLRSFWSRATSLQPMPSGVYGRL